ncbi:MAG TPA: hypothetical protein VEC16_01970, partial [Alphaproteobacteria bacterium]|nr:hypothetical protein [Alphaproteobacteria bacterium]
LKEIQVSKNLSNPSSDSPFLVADNVANQCEMRGNHFCMSGVWRKKVTTSDGEDLEFPGKLIQQKYYPEQNPEGITYDSKPEDITESGCCPSDYCWDGNVCVNSKYWRDNATKPGIWNNLLIGSLIDNHTMTSDQLDASGYRCISQDVWDTKGTTDTSDDTKTVVASWTPAQIKYDWNYENSGYCANTTDCFVNYVNDFPGGLSKGCTPNGTIVNDRFVSGSGNHYCHLGEWTTKSYIIASLLQGMMTSTTSDTEYTLSCYDDLDVVYNSLPVLPDESPEDIRVASACVLTQPDHDSRLKIKTNVQIITGVVLQDDSKASSNSFIDKIIVDYERSFGTGTISKPATECTASGAPLIGPTAFTQCISTTKGDFFVYYDTTYKYFILSNKRVTGIEGTGWLESLWIKISEFFENVFGLALDITPYDSISYTTSYDRIYITRTADIDVTAIEEAKYDEDEKTTVDVLYVKYDGTTIENNPINTAEIDRLLDEQTVPNSNQEIVPNVIRTDYLPTDAPQEITIKSHERINMWEYFTTILRVQE